MSSDYARIQHALRYLDEHADIQPTLDDVATEIGVSPFHCQRLFRRWAGVSPKRFLQYLTVDHAKRLLRESATVLDTSYEVGLSGPGRLHDHFVSVEAMTPGEYKRLGQGLEIRYGRHPSPFGEMLVATTQRGVCAIAFDRTGVDDRVWLEREWGRARLVHDPAATAPVAARLFAAGEVPLLVRGTNFQVQVWRALLEIPSGALVSYADVARRIGRPSSARAVAGAVAANRVAFLIPCHRVIRSLGETGGYRWGSERKRAMIGWEAAARETESGSAARTA